MQFNHLKAALSVEFVLYPAAVVKLFHLLLLFWRTVYHLLFDYFIKTGLLTTFFIPDYMHAKSSDSICERCSC